MTSEGTEAVAWMKRRIGKFRYSNDWDIKFDPDRTGAGDCSSVIRRAYLDTSGIDVGNMSYRQAEYGTEVMSGYGMKDFEHARCEPGDIIAMDLVDKFVNRIDHVELYYGLVDGEPHSIGHGGYPFMGPNIHPLKVGYLLGAGRYFTVRRVGASPGTVAGKLPTPPGASAGKLPDPPAPTKYVTVTERMKEMKFVKNRGKVYTTDGVFARHVPNPTVLKELKVVQASNLGVEVAVSDATIKFLHIDFGAMDSRIKTIHDKTRKTNDAVGRLERVTKK